jgi:hypothetical protein
VGILGGDGRIHFIPRLTLCTLPGQLPFTLTRKQSPVKISFAMAGNKSQGQPLKSIGIDLRCPVFCHGQLYVALYFNQWYNRIILFKL